MKKIPESIKKILIRAIPQQLIKQREGGGKKMLSYISGQTVTDMLNEAFGYLWSWEAEKEWIQPSIDKQTKYDKEPVPQGPVAHVKGKLTVQIMSFGEDNQKEYVTISKTGYGSKCVLGSQADQESIFKAAGTDALKKAASLFGIGLSLYRDEDEQTFFDEMNFEDPWTDELIAQYATQRDFIPAFMKDHELDITVMNELVQEFSNGILGELSDIIPGNIDNFITFLQNKVKESAQEE